MPAAAEAGPGGGDLGQEGKPADWVRGGWGMYCSHQHQATPGLSRRQLHVFQALVDKSEVTTVALAKTS